MKEPIDKFYKSKAWLVVRRTVLIRDNYKCQWCGARVTLRFDAHVDHIKKRRDYPELALDPRNLQTLCSTCHNKFKQSQEKKPRPQVSNDGYIEGEWTDDSD